MSLSYYKKKTHFVSPVSVLSVSTHKELVINFKFTIYEEQIFNTTILYSYRNKYCVCSEGDIEYAESKT